MKLSGNIKGGRPPKLIERLRAVEVARPEIEQPLSFDLQSVIDLVKKLGMVSPRLDVETLLGLAGPQYFRQVVSDVEGLAKKKTAVESAIHITMQKGWRELMATCAQSKLLDPEHFDVHRWWAKDKLSRELRTHLALLKANPVETWAQAVELLVLFPEQRQLILDIIRPNEVKRLAYIENEPTVDPDYMDFEELAFMKMLDQDQVGVDVLVKKRWSKWQAWLDRVIKRAREEYVPGTPSRRTGGPLCLAISMYILAADKVCINDQGLPEITPRLGKISAPPQLPVRSALE